MNYKDALNKNMFISGDIIAFFNGSSFFDDTIEFVEHASIYHVGVVVQRQNNLMLYQATDTYGINRVPLAAAVTNLPFILIKPNLWSQDAEDFADSKIGNKYGWLNALLTDFYLNHPAFGFICSTYAASILNKAGANLPILGLTPARLSLALAHKGFSFTISGS